MRLSLESPSIYLLCPSGSLQAWPSGIGSQGSGFKSQQVAWNFQRDLVLLLCPCSLCPCSCSGEDWRGCTVGLPELVRVWVGLGS